MLLKRTGGDYHDPAGRFDCVKGDVVEFTDTEGDALLKVKKSGWEVRDGSHSREGRRSVRVDDSSGTSVH